MKLEHIQKKLKYEIILEILNENIKYSIFPLKENNYNCLTFLLYLYFKTFNTNINNRFNLLQRNWGNTINKKQLKDITYDLSVDINNIVILPTKKLTMFTLILYKLNKHSKLFDHFAFYIEKNKIIHLWQHNNKKITNMKGLFDINNIKKKLNVYFIQ